VVSSTPRPHFTSRKDPVSILQEAGWTPGPVWTDGKSRPHRDSIPDSIYLYILKKQQTNHVTQLSSELLCTTSHRDGRIFPSILPSGRQTLPCFSWVDCDEFSNACIYCWNPPNSNVAIFTFLKIVLRTWQTLESVRWALLNGHKSK